MDLRLALGFLDSASARYDGNTGQVFGELAYGMSFGKVAVEPFADFAWVHMHTNSFSETGGAGALNGASVDQNSPYSSLGIRAASIYLMQNGWALIPRASLAWQHAFSGLTPTTPLAFQNSGVGFVVAGVPLARDSALAEAGFDIRVSPNSTLGVAYTGQFANNLQDHGVRGFYTVNF